MTPTEVTEKLGLLRMKDRSWYCHPSNALDGEGLFEGASALSLLFQAASPSLESRRGARHRVRAAAMLTLPLPAGLNWLSQNIKAQK